MTESLQPATGPKQNWPRLPVGLALLIYAFGVLLTLGIRVIVDGDSWLIALHIAAVVSLYVLWRQGYWGDGRVEGFGTVVLLAAILYRLLGIVDVLFWGSRMEEWPDVVYSDEAWWAILRGEAATHLSVVLSVFSWHWVIGKTSVRTGFLEAAKQHGKGDLGPWLLYLFTLVLAIGRPLFGLEYDSAEQIVRVVYLSGIAAIFLIAITKPNDASRILWAAALALPLSLIGASSGMKENIIIPLLPAAFLLWMASRTITAKLATLAAGVAFIVMLQTFIVFARPFFWSETEQTLPIMDTIQQFQAETNSESQMEGLKSIVGRLNLTNAHAWSVALVDRLGYDPEGVFGPAEYVLIPRFFWPDKPLGDPGLDQTQRLLGLEYDSSIRTSTAAGFGGELYVGYGWIGVVLGSIVFGLVVAACQMVVARLASETALLIFNLTALIGALRFDEKHLVYEIAGMIVFVLGLLVIGKVLDLFVPKSPSIRSDSVANIVGHWPGR